MPRKSNRVSVLQGTLDMLILHILELGPMHGYGLTRRLEQISRGTFQINPGTLFPALHQMEEAGWIRGEWSLTENNRRAKAYSVTKKGRSQLARERKKWQQLTGAIDLVLQTTEGG